jgi:hypothetical protein
VNDSSIKGERNQGDTIKQHLAVTRVASEDQPMEFGDETQVNTWRVQVVT